MRSTSLLATAVTLVLGLAVAGCGGKDPASPATAGGPRFNFTFPVLGPDGTSHELQINDIGTWNYVCTPHASQMTGTIVVAAAGPDSATIAVGPGSSTEFQPSTVTIRSGGKVRWQNQSTTFTNHTATR